MPPDWQPTPPRGWHALLLDCMEVVLRYLEPVDIALLRTVCKSWRQHTQLLLWQLAPALGCDLAEVAACFPALTSLQLTPRMSVEAIAPSAAAEPAVSVDAAAPQAHAAQPHQDVYGLGALTSLRHLRRLSLQAASSPAAVHDLDGDTLLPLAQLPQLEGLELQGFHLHSCSALQQLAQLSTLALVSCSLEDGHGSLASLLRPLSRLSVLRFSSHLWRSRGSSSAATEPFDGLSSLAGLTSVTLGACELVDDAACAELAALPRLARLEISRSHKDANSAAGVTDAGVASFAALSSQLVRLILRGHGGISDAGLRHIGKLTLLEHLDLRLHSWDARPPPLPGISDEGVGHLTALTRLHTLKLGWCSLAEAGCDSIAALTGLHTLELHSCTSLRDAGLFRLRRLPALLRFGLRGCTGVSDIGLAALAKAYQRQLLHLDLTGCHQNISDAGLASMRGMHLRSLGLAHCEAITDAGLEACLAGPLGRSLRSLDCRDCSRLTDRACALLAASCLHLERLSLEHCPHVTQEGLGRLAALQSLHELQLFGSGVTAADVRQLVRRPNSSPRLRVVMRKQAWWVS